MGNIISSQINEFSRPFWNFCYSYSQIKHRVEVTFSSWRYVLWNPERMLSSLTIQARGGGQMPTWHRSPLTPSFCKDGCSWLCLSQSQGQRGGTEVLTSVCSKLCVSPTTPYVSHTCFEFHFSTRFAHEHFELKELVPFLTYLNLCVASVILLPLPHLPKHCASLTAGRSEQSQRDDISLFFFSWLLSFISFFTFPLFYFSFRCFPLLTRGWLIWWSLLWHCCSCCCRCCCCWWCRVPS